MERKKVSATVITFNEEKNIEDCLKSIMWADEIVVVDSESTDRTVEIARRFTDKVFVNPWPGHKQQKNIAIGHTSHDWILSIDADERASPEIEDFVKKVLIDPKADGYQFRRENIFLGKKLWHGGWYPDRILRLFNKNKGQFGGINPHDRVFIETGTVIDSTAAFTHLAYDSLSQFLKKQDFYSTIAAQEKFQPGKQYRVMPLIILIKGAWKFFEVYILKRGVLDGTHGFVAAMGAMCNTIWKYSKIWEMSLSHRSSVRNRQ